MGLLGCCSPKRLAGKAPYIPPPLLCCICDNNPTKNVARGQILYVKCSLVYRAHTTTFYLSIFSVLLLLLFPFLESKKPSNWRQVLLIGSPFEPLLLSTFTSLPFFCIAQ